MNTYEFNDYRKIIRTKLENLKKLDKTISYGTMSEFMGIQKPYLSKVLNGYADFSTDQMYRACKFLGFTQEEHDYLELLLEAERTQFYDRKESLEKRIEEIQFKHNDTGKRLTTVHQMSAEEFDVSGFIDFYLDPMVSIVHVFLSIPKYAKNVELIKEKLSLTDEHFSQILSKMERMKVIEVSGEKIVLKIPQMHLPRDSKIVIPHQKLMSHLIAFKKGDISFEEKKSFMVTFAANDKAKKKIEVEFNHFLDKVKDIAMNSKASDCYQMCFDLFPWS